MKNGFQKFDFFLNQFETVLAKAGKQKNPALYLYKNNARTPLFMLEALSKMYAELHNKKRFSKMKGHFKLLEDALGAVDYYDAVAKNLSTNKKIPAAVISYLQAQTREKIQRLNELLTEKKWLGASNGRVLKIREKLEDADWMDAEKEIKNIHAFYGDAIKNIIDFTHSTSYHFDNMEEDVHELRRKLRWLSIYPQALKGAVQLVERKSKPKHLSKYLTPGIINSPFNKMPDAEENRYFLLLEKNRFYALSWMIFSLGELKDRGLQIVALKEALQQTENLDEISSDNKAYAMLGNKQVKMKLLLENAAAISKKYFEEKNLEALVEGTARQQ